MNIRMDLSLQGKILAGYAILVAVVIGIAAILVHERQRIREIEAGTEEIRSIRLGINAAHRRITELAMQGESVMAWEVADYKEYRMYRMGTDSLLQTLKPHCTRYVRPEQIDTLRYLLADKEVHLLHIMQIFERLNERDSVLAKGLPEVARRVTGIRTVERKKKGIAGFFGRKEKVRIMPSAEELYQFSDSLIAMQQKQTNEMDVHTDSLRIRNRILNRQLNRLINDLDTQAQTSFSYRERKIAETQKYSYRLFTATLSGAIILLTLSYLAIHREIRCNIRVKRKREELIKKLQESIRQNEELTREKQNIMQTITHELRSPLSAIRGYAEMIVTDEERSSRIRHAKTIGDASRRMAEMIDTLLNYFRLDSGKETVRSLPFRLKSIADTLETEFMPQMEKKRLAFETVNEADEVVIGDRSLILRIGSNLLSNALKFTQKGAVKLITGYSDGNFILTVDDTGTGIDKEKQDRIFKPFERLGNAATQDGFGLGLSIVKRIVDMMHGKIRLESEKGRGSRFTVEVPMNTADGISDEEKYKPERRFERSFSVIVLDDNDILLSMVRDMYAHCGIRCDACDNTGDLMEAVRTRNYDLLITDLKMPETNGYEVLELLRSSDIGNSKTIPVIVATASGSCTEEELLVHGFTACLFKPFDMAELIDVSEKCLLQKTDVEEYPDLSSLLAYGNKTAMLDRLITETEKDMQAMREAFGRLDRKALDEQVHRLRSSWAVIRADGPLWKLHELLHRDEKCSDEELRHSVNGVLRMGTAIIELARKEKKEEVR